VNGSFFTDIGMELAVDGALERLGVTAVPSHLATISRTDLEQAGLAAAKSAFVLRQ
jgi:hypothetical protein